MKGRTRDDRKLKIQMLCDQCGAAVLTGMKICSGCNKPVAEIIKDIATKKARQGELIA